MPFSHTGILPRFLSVQPLDATEAGALSGFAVVCSECGEVAAYSIRTMAVDMAREHADWHAGQGVFGPSSRVRAKR